MKNNYKQLRLLGLAILISFIGHSQNIKISLVNAENTSDGTFDYYEADVTIQTIDGQADFKLGSGQVYINYNSAAFGSNASQNGNFEFTADYDNGGFILGEKFAGAVDIFDISQITDNDTSRVSCFFEQTFSSGAITEIVSSAPKMMAHIKFKFTDVSADPMVAFEADENELADCRDQFFTACGPFDSASTTLDCGDDPVPENKSNQFLDATFDSGQGTLSTDNNNKLVEFTVFPNPTEGLVNVDISVESNYTVYDMLGKEIEKGRFYQGSNEMQLGKYEGGVYFLRVILESAIYTRRIVVK